MLATNPVLSDPWFICLLIWFRRMIFRPLSRRSLPTHLSDCLRGGRPILFSRRYTFVITECVDNDSSCGTCQDLYRRVADRYGGTRMRPLDDPLIASPMH